jgi:polyisoprenoid-binding protein YceI
MSSIATKEQLSTDGIWRVDPAQSNVEFRVKHMVVETVKGRFMDFDGVVVPGEVTRIAGSIRVASLDTDHSERDDHLRSPDFFDAERYPEMVFESTDIELSGDGVLVVVGVLRIKHAARPIQLIGRYRGREVGPGGRERILFSLRGSLNRQDYGLTWNQWLESGGLIVGNTVDLVLDVVADAEVPLEQAA